jgi:hypothetical protein
MHYLKSQIVSDRTCYFSSDEDDKEESNELDYDEDKDQLKEEQEEQIGEITTVAVTTNQVF